MPHPYVTVNGKQWTEILEHLKNSIAYLSLAIGNSVADTDKLVATYRNTIDAKRDSLFEASAHGIVEYCNFYNIEPKEGVHDEFKGIYFTGVAISNYLVQQGLADLNKLHLKAMLGLLDFRLSTPIKANRPELSSRIRKLIDNNAVSVHLGKYGWYLLYKCLFNSANSGTKI